MNSLSYSDWMSLIGIAICLLGIGVAVGIGLAKRYC